MSSFHCSCGFAIDYGRVRRSHAPSLRRDDDIGTDGRTHHELADAAPSNPVCACGYVAANTSEFDDHLLMAFVTPDAIGTDGEKHVPADPSTPDRWYVRESQ